MVELATGFLILVFIVQRCTASAVLSPHASLNFFKKEREWLFRGDGRSLCGITTAPEGTTAFVSEREQPIFVSIGTVCQVSTEIDLDFMRAASHSHETMSSSNFERSIVFFSLSVRVSLSKELYRNLEQLANELDVKNLAEGVFVRVEVEDAGLQYIKFFDHVIADNDEHSEDFVAIYSYVIGFHAHNLKNHIEREAHKRVMIETDLQDIRMAFEQRASSFLDNNRIERVREKYRAIHRSWDFRLQTLTLTHMTQPPKFDFHNENRKRMNEKQARVREEERNGRNVCALLGSSCAAVLRRIQFPKKLLPSLSTREEGGILSSERTLSIMGESDESPVPRVFCGTFTTVSNHQTKVRATRDSWAHKCTAFLAFSTLDDPSLPSIALPHLGEESYSNMWQKTRSILKYLHTHYGQDYDWFLFGGDDAHVIMENLYDYLRSEEIETERAKGQGVYLGRTLSASGVLPDIDRDRLVRYNSGGAGYVLDAVALRVLAHNIDSAACHPFAISSNEDAFVGHCLSLSNIMPWDTRDERGRQRFHVYYLGFEYEYLSLPAALRANHWLSQYDADVKGGDDCCSDRSISAQHLTPQWMLAMSDFLYHCPLSQVDDFYRGKNSSYFDYRGYSASAA